MTYMIVEKYRSGKSKDVYHRFDEKGRMLPDDVTYINSWISEDLTTCYQVLEAPGIEKIDEWISNWNDLVDFEVIPVISSAQAKKKMQGDSTIYVLQYGRYNIFLRVCLTVDIYKKVIEYILIKSAAERIHKFFLPTC